MAKNDLKEVFKGDKDGTPVNGPSESGKNQGAGAVTRLRETPDDARVNLSDNIGKAPYGIQNDVASLGQDKKGDAAFYDEPSNQGQGGDEHQESAADKDVGDYYAELSKRRSPNYDKNANLQTKQAPHDLSPADGADGFIGSNTGPAVDFSYIAGKKGFSEDKKIWDTESSFSNSYPDNSGSDDATILPGAQYSTDEFAPYKYTKGDNGLPQTWITENHDGGVPLQNVEAEGDTGGHPDTQSYPSDTASGNRDFSDLPQTEFTHSDTSGGGAPAFKFAGVKEAESVYSVEKSRDGEEMAGPNPGKS